MHPFVKARNTCSPLRIEAWKGSNEDGAKFAVLHVITEAGRGRSWLMIEPDQWEQLKRLVDETLKN